MSAVKQSFDGFKLERDVTLKLLSFFRFIVSGISISVCDRRFFGVARSNVVVLEPGEDPCPFWRSTWLEFGMDSWRCEVDKWSPDTGLEANSPEVGNDEGMLWVTGGDETAGGITTVVDPNELLFDGWSWFELVSEQSIDRPEAFDKLPDGDLGAIAITTKSEYKEHTLKRRWMNQSSSFIRIDPMSRNTQVVKQIVNRFTSTSKRDWKSKNKFMMTNLKINDEFDYWWE